MMRAAAVAFEFFFLPVYIVKSGENRCDSTFLRYILMRMHCNFFFFRLRDHLYK